MPFFERIIGISRLPFFGGGRPVSRRILLLIGILPLFFLLACGEVKELTQEKSGEKTALTQKEEQKFTYLFFNANREKMIGNREKAIELFRQTLAIDPDNAAVNYELGRMYDDKEDFSTALEYAHKAVQGDPENIWYRVLLADLYRRNGEMEKAVTQYKKIIKQKPGRLEFYFDMASALIELERYQEAIEAYDKVEEQIGENKDIILQKQRLYLQQNKVDEAIEEIRSLIEMAPDNAEYYGMLAELYQKKGNVEKARELYQKVLERDPDNGLAHLSLSKIYRKEGDDRKALEELRKAFHSPKVGIDTKVNVLLNYYTITEYQSDLKEEAYDLARLLVEVHPEEAKAYTVYGDFLYRDDQLRKAREQFRKAVELDPNRFAIWQQILIIDSRLNDDQLLLEDSKEARELFPTQPLTYFFHGVALIETGEPEQGVKVLQEGKSLVVGNDDLLFRFYERLGDAYNTTGQYEKSDQAFEKCLEIDPENIFVLNNYSYYLSMRGEKLDKAATMAQKTNELRPGRSSFQDTYGWVLYKQGKYEKAAEWLKKALDNGGKGSGTILEHYGDTLFRLGQKEEAFEYWQKAKEAGGASDVIDKKIRDKELYE